ncbi:MAG: PDZ domain-containing protein [Opitutae bacterium]
MHRFLNLFKLPILVFFSVVELFSNQEFEINERVNSVYRAIVRIEVVSERGSNGRMLKSGSTGSGVIVDDSGLVVTNHHVAGKATRLTCRFYDGEEIGADLLGADAMTDLAVLRLRLDERPENSAPIQVAMFGDSDEVEVGDSCFAMGSPAGLSQSVTRGIISNLALISNRSSSFRLDGENVGELVRWLGHDAVIFPGNSGGPLVNENGEIIGINEVAIASLGGAIPANLARKVASELAEKGHIERSWTGLECQPQLVGKREGILVSGVINGSPAQSVGILPGDIITHFAGQTVKAKIPEDLPPFHQIISAIPPGKEVPISGYREGKEMNWILITEKREPAYQTEKELKSWGLTVRDFTLLSSLEARREGKHGVLVHTVAQGGPSFSAKPRLIENDVITEINGRKIAKIAELVSLSQELTEGKSIPVPVLVRFERNLANYLSVIKIGPEAEEKRPLEAWKPWLGVSTQVLTHDLAEALGLEKTSRGVRLSQVFPGTPAEQAGLLAGDLVFRIDGQLVQAYRPEDVEVFGNMIKQYRIDSVVTFEVWRDGKTLELNATLTKRPTPANELPEFEDEDLEYTVRELSFADRVFLRISPEEHGVLVENVEAAGWAALAGLRQGDILLQVNQHRILNIEEMKGVMTGIKGEKANQVIFFVKRGIHTLFLELEPEWGPS